MSGDEMRAHICDYYDNLKMRALDKFDRGRKEHGEKFEEINYDAEIENELIDLLNYKAMQEEVNRPKARGQ